jgi:hypothetical protein
MSFWAGKLKILFVVTIAAAPIVLGLWIGPVAVAEEQRQVTVCERHWYCAWLCQTCTI